MPLTPWACRARAWACFPRPIEAIFMRPLSTPERKSVCCLILPTTTTPSASEAMRSIKTGTPLSVSPISTTSIEDRIGAPTDSSVTPRLRRISTCPSAVAPPWLPMAGTMKGEAPASFKIWTSERRTLSIPATPRLPAVIATCAPGSIRAFISSFAHCSRSASPTFSTRGLGKSCLTLTAFGNRISLAPFLGVLLGLSLGTRQRPGEVEGCAHARVVGLACTGDVKRRAVVHAGAEERQAHGDVHAGVEAHQLHGDVPLVVVLHHHDVEHAAPRPHQDRVGRMGAGGLDPLLPRFLDGGGYALCVLGAEEAVLAGVRVQAGYGHFRVLDAELAHGAVGEPDHGELPLGLYLFYGLPQRDVGGNVDDLELVGDEHHRVVLRACEVRQDLRVPRVLVPRQVHGLLVQRSGGYRADAPGARQLGRPLQVPERRVASPRVEHAERQVVGQLAHHEH